ncbi:MAG: hypothetical protein IKJ58_09205 [Akkermansia sp.]|nr:hypothetical protein [Akkermansia sp.]
MSAAFPIFISEITLKSVSICIVLTLVGFLGILLIAMLNDDVFKPYKPDEKYISPSSEYEIEDLLNCNVWEILLLICSGMIVVPILYLLPISLPGWLFYPLVVIVSIILYCLVNRWLRWLRLKWAEEDKQRRRSRSKNRKKKKK